MRYKSRLVAYLLPKRVVKTIIYHVGFCLSLMVQTLAESENFFLLKFHSTTEDNLHLLFCSLKTIIHFYLRPTSQSLTLWALNWPTQLSSINGRAVRGCKHWRIQEWAKFETDCKIIAAVRHLSYSVSLTPCNSLTS